MRLTETLDALLRLLLTSEDGDAPAATAARTAQTAATTRPAEANPPAQDTVSRDGGLPIEDSVHLWRSNDDAPAPFEDEAEANTPEVGRASCRERVFRTV